MAKETVDKKIEDKKPVAPKVVREKQNGITRPGEKTTTGMVWQIADTLSKKLGKPVTRKDVLAACEDKKINPATAATQYGRWRKFNGLKGRGTDEEKK